MVKTSYNEEHNIFGKTGKCNFAALVYKLNKLLLNEIFWIDSEHFFPNTIISITNNYVIPSHITTTNKLTGHFAQGNETQKLYTQGCVVKI